MPRDTGVSENFPEVLEELTSKICEVLIARGIDEPRARDAALDCREWFRRDWGGQRIYIPMGRVYELSQRDREIAATWNGRNTIELCRRYNITESHLRNIAAARCAGAAKRQRGRG